MKDLAMHLPMQQYAGQNQLKSDQADQAMAPIDAVVLHLVDHEGQVLVGVMKTKLIQNHWSIHYYHHHQCQQQQIENIPSHDLANAMANETNQQSMENHSPLIMTKKSPLALPSLLEVTYSKERHLQKQSPSVVPEAAPPFPLHPIHL